MPPEYEVDRAALAPGIAARIICSGVTAGFEHLAIGLALARYVRQAG